jgi:hypothetical protein
MTGRVMVGIFTGEKELLEVTRTVRERGLKIVDVYAPYAVHGLDKAMGLAPSRLPWVCFALGLFGAAFKVWFEYWTSAVDWPINVGGKPWDSLPAFVPITFEVMVLFAGLSTVFAFFLISRLYPGKKAVISDIGTTDDRFALVLEERDAAFDPDEVRALLLSYGAVEVTERAEGLA